LGWSSTDESGARGGRNFVPAPTRSLHHFYRHDRKVTLRHDSKLHHIGLGRAHKGKSIKLLVADQDIRVIDARTGELIRALTLDPSRDYQLIGEG